MEISHIQHDGILQLNFIGNLDTDSADEVDQECSKFIAAGNTKLLLDLSQLDYISSAGLRVLLIIAKQLQQLNGEIALCCMTDRVREIFDISGFSTIFKIFLTAEEALAALK